MAQRMVCTDDKETDISSSSSTRLGERERAPIIAVESCYSN